MKKLNEIVRENNLLNLKVRYVDWQNIKYFLVKVIDFDNNMVFGEFDDGEKSFFSLDSDHWEVYFEGAENCARAA